METEECRVTERGAGGVVEESESVKELWKRLHCLETETEELLKWGADKGLTKFIAGSDGIVGVAGLIRKMKAVVGAVLWEEHTRK
jgi:hypothetical protein